jgi:adenosine deaminase
VDTGAVRDLTALPKAHLHVHLESTVRWSTLQDIGDANGVPVPEHLSAGAVFDGFRSFGDANALIRDCLRTPDDFHRIALEFCADEAALGTAYAEVSFSASSHGDRLGDLAMPLEAVIAGLADGAAYGIECRVLLDHSRRRTERGPRTLDLALRYADQGVIGIGLAGDESYPLAPFKDVLDRAAGAGLHLVHHAGETAGPESIREALGTGRAERIGHGIRILDDPGLVGEIEVPLEVCPTSNVALGLVPSYADHPLPRLLAAGLAVTINTDIPNVLGDLTLTGELTRVRDAFGLDDTALASLNTTAVDASFAPPATKSRLHTATTTWLAGGHDLGLTGRVRSPERSPSTQEVLDDLRGER